MIEWTDDLKRQVSAWIAAGKNSSEITALIAGASVEAVRSGVTRHRLGTMHQESRIVQAPEGFAEDAAVMTHRELSAKYGRSRGVIARWEKRLGIKRERPKAKPKAAKKPNNGWFQAGGPPAPVDRPYREEGPAGDAARELQRYGFVYRCDESGRANPRGKMWRRGSAVLSDMELIDRADFMRRKRA